MRRRTNIPALTEADVNEVMNDFVIPLGQVVIASADANHKIEYNVKDGMYIVRKNSEMVYGDTDKAAAIEYYNNLNSRIDHLF